jgi:hypothetical protein
MRAGRHLRAALWAPLLAQLLAACLAGAVAPASAEPLLRFVALGDMPYGHEPRTGPAYRHLIELINAERLPFAIHVGDFKDGLTECSDAVYDRQFAYFNSYASAVVYTPGDNDWTDCQRQNTDPLERLGALRQRFFSAPRSMGAHPLAVQRQADVMPQHAAYRENLRWWQQGVLFVTVHTVGPDDNAKDASAALQREHATRTAANIDWLRSSFDQARQQSAKALVVATQADVFKDGRRTDSPPPVRKPYRELITRTLLPLAAASPMPVLYIHGDSHRYIVDQPFVDAADRPIRQIWRLQVPGEERMHAVKVGVQPGSAQPFSFALIWNPMSPNPR